MTRPATHHDRRQRSSQSSLARGKAVRENQTLAEYSSKGDDNVEGIEQLSEPDSLSD